MKDKITLDFTMMLDPVSGNFPMHIPVIMNTVDFFIKIWHWVF